MLRRYRNTLRNPIPQQVIYKRDTHGHDELKAPKARRWTWREVAKRLLMNLGFGFLWLAIAVGIMALGDPRPSDAVALIGAFLWLAVAALFWHFTFVRYVHPKLRK